MTGFTVLRAGWTARYWEHTGSDVEVVGMPMIGYHHPHVSITTGISAAGGGTTRIKIDMRPARFKTMVRAMHLADREAFLAAVAEVMHESFQEKASAEAAKKLAAA